MRYPSASPSMSLDQSRHHPNVQTLGWIHDSRFSDISHSVCSKSAQASRSTFAPAEGSTTDLTNHISVILVQTEVVKLNQQNQPCQMSCFKSQTCQKEASVLLSQIWKLQLHWKTLFCNKGEQEVLSHIEAACRIIQ